MKRTKLLIDGQEVKVGQKVVKGWDHYTIKSLAPMHDYVRLSQVRMGQGGVEYKVSKTIPGAELERWVVSGEATIV